MRNANGISSVLVTGGGGYVGSLLVPALLGSGYRVKVIDTFWYGRDVFREVAAHDALELVVLDVRDSAALKEEIAGMDAVIHLACISNDPSFELNPGLGRSINYDAFAGLLDGCVRRGVRRFIYASSSSVYGVKAAGVKVTEEMYPNPMTDYSKYKLACEEVLLNADVGMMEYVIVRPATLCGYAPRLRLDLTVNILTCHAYVNGRIKVFGGRQERPNLSIRDMVRFYELMLDASPDKVHGKVFNVSCRNSSVLELAEMVRSVIGDESISLDVVATDDKRSYRINAERAERNLGFRCRFSIENEVKRLTKAFDGGLVNNALDNPYYYNIKRMQELEVT